MSNDSNRTLRFSRTWREENGCDCEFHDHHSSGDRMVLYFVFFASGFLFAFLVFGGA